MKLFLCGGGSGNQILNALQKFASFLNKEKPILYIPLAMESKKYNDCYNWFENEIKIININNFEMVKTPYELSQKNLNEYSALYIGGGNTYNLLANLKQYDNFKKIQKYLENDGIIFGGSAGAIIFGKNIDGCLMDDKNDINLKDTTGYNYLNNYSILCHLNEKNFNKNLDYLQKYSINNKLIYLPEDNVIFIDDNNYIIIGESKYAIFENGDYKFYTSTNITNIIFDD